MSNSLQLLLDSHCRMGKFTNRDACCHGQVTFGLLTWKISECSLIIQRLDSLTPNLLMTFIACSLSTMPLIESELNIEEYLLVRSHVFCVDFCFHISFLWCYKPWYKAKKTSVFLLLSIVQRYCVTGKPCLVHLGSQTLRTKTTSHHTISSHTISHQNNRVPKPLHPKSHVPKPLCPKLISNW